MTPFHYLVVAGMAALLSGCDGSSDTELRNWIETTRASQPAPHAPLSAQQDQAPNVPANITGANPFAENRVGAPARSEMPDGARRREPLEDYPLESMQMIGMLRQHGAAVAALRIDDRVYHIRVGQYIGQRHGRVVRVTDQEIVVREWVHDGDSDWKEEMTSLKLEASA